MDKRKIANQKVKDRLFAALIEFAGSKDWSRLTVTELIEQSGVARASFYRNFKSVDELVDYGLQIPLLQRIRGPGAGLSPGKDGGYASGRDHRLRD